LPPSFIILRLSFRHFLVGFGMIKVSYFEYIFSIIFSRLTPLRRSSVSFKGVDLLGEFLRHCLAECLVLKNGEWNVFLNHSLDAHSFPKLVADYFVGTFLATLVSPEATSIPVIQYLPFYGFFSCLWLCQFQLSYCFIVLSRQSFSRTFHIFTPFLICYRFCPQFLRAVWK